MRLRNTFMFVLCSFFLVHCNTRTNIISNPICDGYYADPSIIRFSDTYYIYATIDPWGGEELGVLASRDFINWEQKHINWPTKTACTSATSGDAMVWAPSVIKSENGRFYMYVSVGSEIWAGVSEHPLGPWKNARDDNGPLIHRKTFPGYHMIDAQCFIDEDGKTIDATYKIRYSTGRTPYGPWQEGMNSPILSTLPDSITYGPGHHSVFTENDQAYVLYHRIYPQEKELVLRQLCIDSLNFDDNENILKVNPKGVLSFVKNICNRSYSYNNGGNHDGSSHSGQRNKRTLSCL